MPLIEDNKIIGTNLTVREYILQEQLKNAQAITSAKKKLQQKLFFRYCFILSLIVFVIVFIFAINKKLTKTPATLITFDHLNYTTLNYMIDWNEEVLLTTNNNNNETPLMFINAFILTDALKLMPRTKVIYENIKNNVNIVLAADSHITTPYSYYDYRSQKKIINNTKLPHELMLNLFNGTNSTLSSFYSSLNSLLNTINLPISKNSIHLTFDLSNASSQMLMLATIDFVKKFKQQNSKLATINFRLDINELVQPPILTSSDISQYIHQVIFGFLKKLPKTCQTFYNWSKYKELTLEPALISVEIPYWAIKYEGINTKKNIIGQQYVSAKILMYKQAINTFTTTKNEKTIQYSGGNGTWRQTKTTAINYIDNQSLLELLNIMIELNLTKITFNSINYLNESRDYSNVLQNVINKQILSVNSY